MRKRLKSELSMHEILQILSLTLFEKTPLHELLTQHAPESTRPPNHNQLNLLD
jgi:hypothetical protein